MSGSRRNIRDGNAELRLDQVRSRVDAALNMGRLDEAKHIVRGAAQIARDHSDVALERQLCSLLVHVVFSFRHALRTGT